MHTETMFGLGVLVVRHVCIFCLKIEKHAKRGEKTETKKRDDSTSA